MLCLGTHVSWGRFHLSLCTFIKRNPPSGPGDSIIHSLALSCSLRFSEICPPCSTLTRCLQFCETLSCSRRQFSVLMLFPSPPPQPPPPPPPQPPPPPPLVRWLSPLKLVVTLLTSLLIRLAINAPLVSSDQRSLCHLLSPVLASSTSFFTTFGFDSVGLEAASVFWLVCFPFLFF